MSMPTWRPPGAVKRESVDLAPVSEFLAGGRLPLLGDDPRSPTARKIFSAAPLIQDGHTVGYLYVILAGEAYDRLAADVWDSRAFAGGAKLMLAMLALTLVAGLAALRPHHPASAPPDQRSGGPGGQRLPAAGRGPPARKTATRSAPCAAPSARWPNASPPRWAN
jgi:hypothetical protein